MNLDYAFDEPMRIARLFNVWVVALNIALATILYATARSRLPTPATLILVALLILLPIFVGVVQSRRAQWDTGIVLGLVGTALLWIPLFATAYEYVGPFRGVVSTGTDVSIWSGVALLFLSVFWPLPKDA